MMLSCHLLAFVKTKTWTFLQGLISQLCDEKHLSSDLEAIKAALLDLVSVVVIYDGEGGLVTTDVVAAWKRSLELPPGQSIGYGQSSHSETFTNRRFVSSVNTGTKLRIFKS